MCFGGNIEYSNKVSFFLSDVNMNTNEFNENYNSNMIKEIMYCNKDMASGKMSIDLEGVMKLEFENENIQSVYYVIAKEK
jgi:phenylalanine-4-hydroxylase